FYAGCLGLLLVVLSFNVMYNWVRITRKGQETDKAMRRAERLLASFVEYVPLGLILLMLVEIDHTPPAVLHTLGCSLVAARGMHAYGSNEMPGADILRFIGTQLTFLMLTITSMACLFYFGIGHV